INGIRPASTQLIMFATSLSAVMAALHALKETGTALDGYAQALDQQAQLRQARDARRANPPRADGATT
ncbi:hypothetical protein, partial [Paraburkholderia oxyphila]|uniref:hypothetical protein n=1 Tax=Paraburkholderia oxyphila TaxID=614212 RepID=UPI001C3F1622